MNISFLFLFSFLLSLNNSFAKELILPKPTGLYAVGTGSYTATGSAPQLRIGAKQKPLIIHMFYPANGQKEVNDYQPETLINGIVEGVSVKSYGKLLTKDINKENFQIILFIPDRGYRSQDYTILCEELASQGYFVISLDQSFFLPGTIDLKTELYLKNAWNSRTWLDCEAPFDESIHIVINHIDFILSEYFSDKALEDELMLLGRDSITLIGHRFGGNVAHILGFKDARIKQVIDIDSYVSMLGRVYGCDGVPINVQKKPVLFIRGMLDSEKDPEEDFFSSISNSEVWRPLVGYNAFSDTAYLAHFIPEFGQKYHFLRYTDGKPSSLEAGIDIGEYNIDEWFSIYKEKIINWLRIHEVK